MSDHISNNFCSSCGSSYSVIFNHKKGELYDNPQYCPFCGEIIDEDEEYNEDSED